MRQTKIEGEYYLSFIDTTNSVTTITITCTVLVEKLLRSTSVGKIYVLVKASDKEAALDRLSKEVGFTTNSFNLAFSSIYN